MNTDQKPTPALCPKHSTPNSPWPILSVFGCCRLCMAEEAEKLTSSDDGKNAGIVPVSEPAPAQAEPVAAMEIPEETCWRCDYTRERSEMWQAPDGFWYCEPNCARYERDILTSKHALRTRLSERVERKALLARLQEPGAAREEFARWRELSEKHYREQCDEISKRLFGEPAKSPAASYRNGGTKPHPLPPFGVCQFQKCGKPAWQMVDRLWCCSKCGVEVERRAKTIGNYENQLPSKPLGSHPLPKSKTEPKCSIEGCGEPSILPEVPYCENHEAKYGEEFKICRAKSCRKSALAKYPFSCSLHGGQDYTPRTREGEK